MKVLLYFENRRLIRKSGIGRALVHQMRSLDLNEVEHTLDPKDTYDVAHINTYFLNSLRVLKRCRRKGIPVIVHGHSTKEDFTHSFACWKLLKPFVYKMMEWVYAKADLIITPTPYAKKLIEGYDYVHAPVVAVSNGIDLKKYETAPTEEEKMMLRKRFGLRPEQKLVIGIGWTFERKGTHDFIELAKSFPDVLFIWFGNRNRLSNTRLINKAIRNKSANCLLPGYVPQDVIIRMLHLADCFLFPSYEETEGIVVLEALAAKTPVIARDIGALSYLHDGVDALLAHDQKEFREKIKYALTNDMTPIVTAGHALAKERDLQRIGAQLKSCYEMVLQKDRAWTKKA